MLRIMSFPCGGVATREAATRQVQFDQAAGFFCFEVFSGLSARSTS